MLTPSLSPFTAPGDPPRSALGSVVACWLGILLLCPLTLSAEPAHGRRLTLEPTLFETRNGTRVDAEWGFLEVPENRRNPDSRTIELAFVRLPTTAARPGPPVVYLAGGPGNSGIESAKGLRWPLIDALRQVGDVVLLDQRGTGKSRPGLVCQDVWTFPFDQPLEPTAVLETIREKARACGTELGRRGVDLRAYNAGEIADDVDDLRQALGAPRVHLAATSFGTYLALATLHRHGPHIGRVVLMGVVGPDQTLKLPVRVDRGLERIDRAQSEDLGDPADPAGVSFPRAFDAVLERLDKPIAVTAFDPLTGNGVDLRIGRFDLQLATVRALGDSRSLAALGALYNRMLGGDFLPFARNVLATRKWWIGRAMPYAVLCSAGISPARGQQVEEQRDDGWLGRWIDFPFPEICSSLGIEHPEADLLASLHSDAPVLLVSGTLDLRTPLENAEELLQRLPNGRHLVVEGAGHGDDLLVGSPEIARVAVDFLNGSEVADGRIAARPLWERIPPPPKTDQIPVVETLHGVEISDPYRWLEKDETPESRWWTEVQNRYTDAVLEVLPGRLRLRRELQGLLQFEVRGRPWVRGERSIYSRRLPGEELPSIVLQRDGAAGEEVLVDPAGLGGPPARVGILDVSSEGDLLAFSIRQGGEDEDEIALLDVDRRRVLERLPRARHFGASILPGRRGLTYSRELGPGQGTRLFRHPLGADPATDQPVFGEGYDNATTTWGNLSDDGRFLVQHALSGSRQRVDIVLQDLAHDGERREVVSGVDATFYAGVLGDRLVVHTTWQAPRGRVLVADPTRPGREHWREIIPEQPKGVVQQVYGAAGRLFVEYLEDVRSRLLMFDLEGRKLGEVPFPILGTLEGIRGRWDQRVVYLGFTTFHLPSVVYRYDTETGTLEVWHQTRTVLDPDRYQVDQVWVASADGTRVPMFLIHSRELKRDGSHPTLLTGYGGFGTSLLPAYDAEMAAWLQHGGVVAVASVRGGGELGDTWHQAAVRENKQRSFDDFIAAAEWLIRERYTRPDKLAISGHSNGGLLVAAAMTQRPDLFRAVVCSHPLLDMLRYNQFLAARFWLPEYGSAEREDAFAVLHAYSPYHRFDPRVAHPAVLFLTAAGDTRVAPLHARKMTALMQADGDVDRPVLLRHHQQAGHAGEDISIGLRTDELVDVLGFLFWQLGEL